MEEEEEEEEGCDLVGPCADRLPSLHYPHWSPPLSPARSPLRP